TATTTAAAAPVAVASPVEDAPKPAPAEVAPEAPAKPAPSKRETFAAWLKEKLPPGGELVDSPNAPLGIVHVAREKEPFQSIAKASLDLSDVYLYDEFAKEIVKANLPASRAGVKPGMHVVIPHLIDEPYKTGDAERLGWPQDGQLKGFYIRGDS